MAQEENAVQVHQDPETESMRKLRGWWLYLVTAIAVGLSLFHFYTSGFGVLLAIRQRAFHIMMIFPLAFLLYPATKRSRKDRPSYLDMLFAFLGAMVAVYLMVNYKALAYRAGAATWLDLTMGVIAIFLILEATRRNLGIALPLIAGIFMIYAYFGPYMPGLLAHRGFSLTRIISHLYLTTEGIMGIPLGVSATFVFLFVLFGAFLEQSGVGEYLLDISFAGLGHLRGGPAKAAVLASASMGLISGSSVANVVTTGSFTIPVMKKVGFKPEVAGAVEVAASTNGQFLPPVMGAAAFIMVEFTGIPYVEIVKAAFLPAILSYVAIFGIVHLEAVKTGLKGIPREELKPFGKTFLRGAHYLLPIIGLIYLLLVLRMTPLSAAFWGINIALIVSFLTKVVLLIWCKAKKIQPGTVGPDDLPFTPTKESRNGVFSVQDLLKQTILEIFHALQNGAKNMVGIAMACGCAGIVIGVITLTGLGLRITSLILHLAGGSLFLTLALTMIASLILGLGLPTTAKYIIVSTLTAPAMVKLGVPMIAAHLFVLYFGILADDTPPVGLAAYGAAAIAKSDPIKTGFLGFKFDMAAFILPFIYVYSPMMLMIDVHWAHLIWMTFTAVLGMYAWSAGVQNFFIMKTNIVERILLMVFAVLVVSPTLLTDIVGLAGVGTIYFLQRRRTGKPLLPWVQAKAA